MERIGTRVVKREHAGKVTARSLFVADYPMHGVLSGRLLRASIARVSFAGVFQQIDGRIINMSAAFGAVSDRVLRYRGAEEVLLGKTPEEAAPLREDWLKAYEERLEVRDGRISAEYRRRVCLNLLSEFYAQCLGSREGQ